jgi:hypothetical protein
MDARAFDWIRSTIAVGAVLTVPRILTCEEFDGEPKDSWLREEFGVYQEYVSSSNWNSFLALETLIKGQTGECERLEVVYDVRFVPYTHV